MLIAELSPTALFQSNDMAAMRRWTAQLVWVSTDGPAALIGPALVEQLEALLQAAVGGAGRLWRYLPVPSAAALAMALGASFICLKLGGASGFPTHPPPACLPVMVLALHVPACRAAPTCLL